jgi:beta-mannanase
MSRRKGIGAEWIEKYKSDVYPNDYVVINGKEVRPPRYYDSFLSETELEEIKKKRQENKILIDRYDENMDRLWVREEVKVRKLEKLVRNL